MLSHRTRRSCAGALGSMLLLSGLIATASPALADVTTPLGWVGVDTVTMDGARQHVLLTHSGELKIADLDGDVLTTLALDGAASAVSIAGSTMYYTDWSGSRIGKVNLTTNVEGTTVASDVPAGTGLAIAGGWLWTSSNSLLSRVNVGTGAVTTYEDGDMPDREALLATDPSDADRLVALSLDGPTTHSILTVYDATTSPPSVEVTRTLDPASGLAFSPDGASLFVSVGGDILELSPTALTTVDMIPTARGIEALTSTNSHVAALSDVVEVFAHGGDQPTTTYGDPMTGISASGSPLAFSPSGNELVFATTAGGTERHLVVMQGPTLPSSTISLSGPTDAEFGDTIHLAGTLTFADAASAAGEIVDIVARLNDDQTFDKIGQATVGAGGAWAFDLPTDEADGGEWRFKATFEGDASHRPSTSPELLTTVDWVTLDLELTTSSGRIDYGDTVRLDVSLEPTPFATDPVVKIQEFRDGFAPRNVGTVSPDDDGLASLVVKPRTNVQYRASTEHDGVVAAAQSTKRRVLVRAIVDGRLVGYSGTSGGAKVYRAGANPGYVVKVTPDQTGEWAQFELERRSGGRWVRVARESFRLARDSKLLVVVNGARLQRRITYRIRAWYSASDLARGEANWASFRVA